MKMLKLYHCAIIWRHAGYRIQTDPSPHPSPLGSLSSVRFTNSVGIFGNEFWVQTRRERRAYPSAVCKERTTKSEPKRHAARRVAPHLAFDFVAARSQIAADMLPRRAAPKAKCGATNAHPICEQHTSASLVFVAQTASLSVSPEIVAARDEFSDRGCVRSTSRSMAAIPTRCGWVFDHSRGPFWLRLGRAALYRRMPSCRTAPWPGRRNTAKALPICNRRYGRLYDCAIISRHAGYAFKRTPHPIPLPSEGRGCP